MTPLSHVSPKRLKNNIPFPSAIERSGQKAALEPHVGLRDSFVALDTSRIHNITFFWPKQ